MKNFLKLIVLLLLISSCKYFEQDVNLLMVKNPEVDIYKIHEGFELESLKKEDLNGDGFLDITISGYDEYMEWRACFFIHNGTKDNTYTYISEEEYWADMEGENSYVNIEDYFEEIGLQSNIEKVVYGDLNGDGLNDAVVVCYYEGEYFSTDTYIFMGVEGGFIYKAMAETNYPSDISKVDALKNIVLKDGYFTIELAGEQPTWFRYITFKYDEDYDDFILYKDGGKVFDEEGNLVKDEVLTSEDFGEIIFSEFIPDSRRLFSLKQVFKVSNLSEFLQALGNDRIIYLAEGIYQLNHLKQLPLEAQQKHKEAKNSENFYTTDFYGYSCGFKNDSTDLSIVLKNLHNMDIVGVGDVSFVVDNEFVKVLSYENCSKTSLENVYLVHDVGGVCGASVIQLSTCDKMFFEDCVFDGSGEIAVLSYDSYNSGFQSCQFTNCSRGALEFYKSDADFESCIFDKNEVWRALISAYSNSSIRFYKCSFSNNEEEKITDPDETSYLFLAKEGSYIFLDEDCDVRNNVTKKLVNNKELVSISNGVVY